MKVLSIAIVLLFLAVTVSAQDAPPSPEVADDTFECGLTWPSIVTIEISVTGLGSAAKQFGYRDFVVKYDGVARDIEYFLPSPTDPGRYFVSFILQDYEEPESKRDGIKKLSVALKPQMKTLGLKVVIERAELADQ